MDYDWTFKLGSIVIGAFGVWKLIADHLSGRHGHLREEYRFAREFFAELDRHPGMHPFLKQKGYQAIANDTRMRAPEIEYLLTLQDPAQAMKDFSLGRHYLEHDPTAAGAQIHLKPKFRSPWSRRMRRGAFVLIYFITYSAGVAPAILYAWGLLPPQRSALLFVFTAACFFPAAWLSITAAVRLRRAEALALHQPKLTPPILVTRPRG